MIYIKNFKKCVQDAPQEIFTLIIEMKEWISLSRWHGEILRVGTSLSP